MDPFVFILAALASYRLAHLFSQEKGPGDIFTAIRDAHTLPQGLKDGIACLLCESVWWAGVITFYLVIIGLVGLRIAPLYWLAASATACIIHFKTRDQP